jgi:hypothetical protein
LSEILVALGFVLLLLFPFYVIYASLVFRRVWDRSRVRAIVIVLIVPLVIALLLSPTLIY